MVDLALFNLAIDSEECRQGTLNRPCPLPGYITLLLRSGRAKEPGQAAHLFLNDPLPGLPAQLRFVMV